MPRRRRDIAARSSHLRSLSYRIAAMSALRWLVASRAFASMEGAAIPRQIVPVESRPIPRQTILGHRLCGPCFEHQQEITGARRDRPKSSQTIYLEQIKWRRSRKCLLRFKARPKAGSPDLLRCMRAAASLDTSLQTAKRSVTRPERDPGTEVQSELDPTARLEKRTLANCREADPLAVGAEVGPQRSSADLIEAYEPR
jgi:hypothetical protein